MLKARRIGHATLENLVETVRATTGSLAAAKKRGLKPDVAERLAIGVGGEQHLTQVRLNLVGNALTFTDRGGLCIAAALLPGPVAVSAFDTSPAKHRRGSSSNFTKSTAPTARPKAPPAPAIATQIVEMHRGRARVESTLGKGATFRPDLPILAQNQKAMV